MPSATFQIDQERPGPSTSYGTPGVARKDVWKDRYVHVHATDPPAGASYFWEFIDKPAGSSAEFLDPGSGAPDNTVPNPKFMPDCWGPYRVRNTVSGGLYVSTKVVHASHDYVGNLLMSGMRLPAFGEVPDEVNWDIGGGGYNERGYAPDFDKFLVEFSGGRIPLLNGADSHDTDTPKAIGAEHFDITRIPHEPGVLSVVFRAILEVSDPLATAHLDLYDHGGIFNGGTPAPITGSALTTQSAVSTMVEVDLTSTWTGSWDTSGIIEARLWVTPTGSGYIATCKMAKIFFTGL